MSRRIGQMIVIVVSVALLRINDSAQAQEQAPPPAQPAAEFHQGGFPETYQGAFYPGAELRALPTARAQAAVAKAEFRRAQISLDNAIAEIRRSFLRSPEVVAAMAEEKAAFEELNVARQTALAELRNDSTYQSAVDLRTRLIAQIEQSKDRADSTPAERVAMATVKLSYATTITAMEAAAQSADPKVPAARQRLVAAGRRLSALYNDFDEAVRTSPNVLAARKAVEDTRIAAVGADALFVEARNVAGVAMDYAYNLYGQPYPYVYNSPTYGGYGYPVQVGYPIGYPLTYPHQWGPTPTPHK